MLDKEQIDNWEEEDYTGMCLCMGPYPGEKLCPCEKREKEKEEKKKK